MFAAQGASNAYLVVVLGVVLSAALVAVGWAFKKLGDHDSTIGVLKERTEALTDRVEDLERPEPVTRLQRRER